MQIKNCSVVLERLDDKLLSQYLKKYNTIKVVDFLKRNKIHFPENSKKNRRKSKKSTGKNEFKRRKKNKVSSASDFVSSNETQNIKKIKDERNNCLNYAENEKEVIQENRKAYILEKDDVEHTDFDEDDEREDNEDDRMTVIFEESPKKKDKECSVEKFETPTVKIAEKSLTDELIRENYLKKLSNLINRLHKLFRIISQLQNEKQSVNFLKNIKAQKMSLVREIKMIQKPVIECYEKLLTFYEYPKEVITKVSQIGLLRLEDVSNIISQCLLLDEFQKATCFDHVSDDFKKEQTEKKVSKGKQVAPQSFSFQPPEGVSYQYEIIPNADAIPAQKDQKSSQYCFVPFYNVCVQKQNIWAQQKYPLQNDFRYPSAIPDFLKRNVQSPNCNPQNMTYDSLVQSVPSEVPTFYVQQFYIQQKPGLEQFNFGSPAQNISTFYQRNNTKRFIPILSNLHNNEQKHPSGDYVSDHVRFSKQQRVKEINSKQRQNATNPRIEIKNTPNFTLPVKNQQTRPPPSAAKRETEVSKTINDMEISNRLRKRSSNHRKYICAQNNCKMPGKIICKGCQSVIYCSETCQLKNWALKHKTECYQLRELRLACTNH